MNKTDSSRESGRFRDLRIPMPIVATMGLLELLLYSSRRNNDAANHDKFKSESDCGSKILAKEVLAVES